MADALDPSIIAAVANGNFKVLAEAPILDSTAHRNRLNILAETALGETLASMRNLNVPEGLGIAAAQRGDFTKVLAELGGITASIQQLMKGAQTTPPATA